MVWLSDVPDCAGCFGSSRGRFVPHFACLGSGLRVPVCHAFSLAGRTESLDANSLLLNPCAGQCLGGGIREP
jgi:hypothetical protein